MTKKPYYRIAELSSRTGIPKTTLYDAVRKGQVQALRLGEAVYVPEQEAKRLLGVDDGPPVPDTARSA